MKVLIDTNICFIVTVQNHEQLQNLFQYPTEKGILLRKMYIAMSHER